jgi:hypothetical protein
VEESKVNRVALVPQKSSLFAQNFHNQLMMSLAASFDNEPHIAEEDEED